MTSQVELARLDPNTLLSSSALLWDPHQKARGRPPGRPCDSRNESPSKHSKCPVLGNTLDENHITFHIIAIYLKSKICSLAIYPVCTFFSLVLPSYQPRSTAAATVSVPPTTAQIPVKKFANVLGRASRLITFIGLIS
jgi:hypothetical protein